MENDRIKLIPPSLDYVEEMHRAILESREELEEFLDWVGNTLTIEQSIEAVNKAIQNFENFENELRFTIISKSDNSLLGKIGLIIRNKSIPYYEIGYWIRSSEAGKGYVSDAVKILEEYAFNELKASRLEIKCAESNIRSRRVAEKCGYECEGTLKNDRLLPSGKIDNTMIFAKTKQ